MILKPGEMTSASDMTASGSVANGQVLHCVRFQSTPSGSPEFGYKDNDLA